MKTTFSAVFYLQGPLPLLTTEVGQNACLWTMAPRNLHRRERVSTIHLLVKIACFVNKKKYIIIIKAPDLNLLVQGGQLYRSFPFSNDSLVAEMYHLTFGQMLFDRLTLGG
jgi:hypothetical protein